MHRKAAWSVLAFSAIVGCDDGAPPAARAQPIPTDSSRDVRYTVAAFAGMDGGARMRALGCGSCHAGEGAPMRAMPLAAGAGPRDPAALFVYLTDALPAPPRQDGARMPDFHLDEAEALALALHLGSGRAAGDARARFERVRDTHPDVDAADGARLFDALRCGACHSAEARAADAPSLAIEGSRVQE